MSALGLLPLRQAGNVGLGFLSLKLCRESIRAGERLVEGRPRHDEVRYSINQDFDGASRRLFVHDFAFDELRQADLPNPIYANKKPQVSLTVHHLTYGSSRVQGVPPKSRTAHRDLRTPFASSPPNPSTQSRSPSSSPQVSKGRAAALFGLRESASKSRQHGKQTCTPLAIAGGAVRIGGEPVAHVVERMPSRCSARPAIPTPHLPAEANGLCEVML